MSYMFVFFFLNFLFQSINDLLGITIIQCDYDITIVVKHEQFKLHTRWECYKQFIKIFPFVIIQEIQS